MTLAQIQIATSNEFYLGWGTLMLIHAALARGMGRSGLGWFGGALFIGPIATFLLAVLGPLRKR